MGTRFRCHVCLLLCLITGTELAAQTSNWTEIQKRYKLGVEAVQAGHDAEAEEDFRAILRLDPKNASAHANLGSIAFRHGDFTQASKEFRAALDLDYSADQVMVDSISHDRITLIRRMACDKLPDPLRSCPQPSIGSLLDQFEIAGQLASCYHVHIHRIQVTLN